MFFLEFIKVALLAGLTIGLVRYFLFKPFYVKGQSMVPTFYEREYLIVDEITYRFREPERGEVIVFRAPIDEKDFYLKRVIGLPGERVRVDDNKIVIYNEKYPEGVVVEESYLPISKKTSGSVIFTLGADEYFVLGDNREASFDSRRFGPIPRSDIIGRTVFRGWPFSRISTFSTPEYNF
ncbi:MAG: signal peptidase I [Candidatus Magasanikbacteria bacterium RIFCSPLOWO2_12_FULL_47_9b]|nr:MAG: signal peptidase I [Candidatus Magasanikbacteria bacterium RIFCSPLOWO2_02_FULL_47_16]OGH80294.1 MAG: signal peptidase I [Candidatus Magasanikbacteria bacterium RIFCSPHIGHO2_02_FULL_48_18]OGH81995.1 MAG: signal peptidase I [Candidatus Magasanikbacteria bacterium RIFCSPLOWO2_12_FULL_47_9b]